jgi:ribosomal protein L11 methyltransferase
VLDPGLSFGTGQHPTTRFCLSQLVACRNEGVAQSFLDVGTGSGILAITAAKVGYKPVVAFDCDPQAVKIARANARANGVAKNVLFSRRDLSELQPSMRRFDVICANLISSLLIAEQRRICRWLAPKGTLVLSGILRSEFAQVRRAYRQSGFRLSRRQSEAEWESGSFVFA